MVLLTSSKRHHSSRPPGTNNSKTPSIIIWREGQQRILPFYGIYVLIFTTLWPTHFASPQSHTTGCTDFVCWWISTSAATTALGYSKHKMSMIFVSAASEANLQIRTTTKWSRHTVDINYVVQIIMCPVQKKVTCSNSIRRYMTMISQTIFTQGYNVPHRCRCKMYRVVRSPSDVNKIFCGMGAWYYRPLLLAAMRRIIQSWSHLFI